MDDSTQYKTLTANRQAPTITMPIIAHNHLLTRHTAVPVSSHLGIYARIISQTVTASHMTRITRLLIQHIFTDILIINIITILIIFIIFLFKNIIRSNQTGKT